MTLHTILDVEARLAVHLEVVVTGIAGGAVYDQAREYGGAAQSARNRTAHYQPEYSLEGIHRNSCVSRCRPDESWFRSKTGPAGYAVSAFANVYLVRAVVVVDVSSRSRGLRGCLRIEYRRRRPG